MSLIKRLIILLFFVFFVVLGVIFASDNPSYIPLNIFGIQIPSVAIGLALSVVFFLGVLLGWCFSHVSNFFIRRTISKKDRLIEKQSEELATLRAALLRD